jgi:hypothetical protein
MMFRLIKDKKRLSFKMTPGSISEQLVAGEFEGLPLAYMMALSSNFIRKKDAMGYVVDVWNSKLTRPGTIAELWLKNVTITSLLKRGQGAAVDYFKLEAKDVTEKLQDMDEYIEVGS